MFNSITHQGKVNQNFNDILLYVYSVGWMKLKTPKTPKVDKNLEQPPLVEMQKVKLL